MTKEDRVELAAIREQLREVQENITEILGHYVKNMKRSLSEMGTIQTIRGEENED